MACPRCGAVAGRSTIGGLCLSCVLLKSLDHTFDDDALPLDERYEILNVLGGGPHGLTYLARARAVPAKPLALKILGRGCRAPGEEQLRSYLGSIRGLTGLRVAPVLDAGVSEDGRVYIATEFMVGRHLTTHCARKRLGPGERLQLVADVCTTIAGAHNRGLVHGHLVPSNVVVANGGESTIVMDVALAPLALGSEINAAADCQALANMVSTLLMPDGPVPARRFDAARSTMTEALAGCDTAAAIGAAARRVADGQT
jgi:tRNA A-37 threonylcarbamoyl transferase component Bud32